MYQQFVTDALSWTPAICAMTFKYSGYMNQYVKESAIASQLHQLLVGSRYTKGILTSTSITETSSPCLQPQEKVANYAKAYGNKVQSRWV